MNRYFLKRLVLLFPVLAIVLFLTMLLGHIAGEVPPHLYEANNRQQFSEQSIENYKEKSGLNESFFYYTIKAEGSSLFYYPSFKWNGSSNRFHRYLSGFLSGDLGYSLYYKDKVWSVIKMPILRTAIINLLVLLIVYSFGLYLGYYQSLYQNSFLAKLFNTTGHIFYALPSFWLAILLIWLLANQQNLYLFPANGWNWDANQGILNAVFKLIWSLILPVFCMSIGSVIYIANIFHQKIEEEKKKTYYKALVARGFSKNYILKKHIFKLAIIPVIAISTDLFPALISGSVIIESIFNIPGMGRLAFQAFFTKDLQIIYAITVLATILTWANWVIADYLYSKLDPRIQF